MTIFYDIIISQIQPFSPLSAFLFSKTGRECRFFTNFGTSKEIDIEWQAKSALQQGNDDKPKLFPREANIWKIVNKSEDKGYIMPN